MSCCSPTPSQSEALLTGKTPAADEPHRLFEGEPAVDVHVVRCVDAQSAWPAHRHARASHFVQGVLWGIASFDQWGVELGKALANALIPEIRGEIAEGAHDPSTSKLVSLVRR